MGGDESGLEDLGTPEEDMHQCRDFLMAVRVQGRNRPLSDSFTPKPPINLKPEKEDPSLS